MHQGLSMHETLNLHEILTFKNVCITKASTMQALVSDEQLKAMLRQDVEFGQKQIREIQGILSNKVKNH